MKRRKKNVATLEIRKEPKNKREIPRSITKIFQKTQKPQFAITKKLNFEDSFVGKNVYFLDITALLHFSGPLYGGFLSDEQFMFDCIVPGENNIFVTDEEALQDLQAMENDKEQKFIYNGYTAFIARNLFVISSEEAANALMDENILREIVDNTEGILKDEFFAHTMGSLRHLYNNNIDPILISFNETTIENALRRTYSIYNIK